ncbi:MAG: hypothetical protein JWO67_4864 [Streptosporangiaceae bacterium]|nr:hypothetical protein [Streptosporangiaceae bacterium]
MTCEELKRRITASELVFWQAYEREYGPIGQQRDDILAAWVSMFTVAPHRGEDAGPLELDDYMPKWRADPKPDEDEQQQRW